jgi:hypothetical protein
LRKHIAGPSFAAFIAEIILAAFYFAATLKEAFQRPLTGFSSLRARPQCLYIRGYVIAF